MPGRRLARANPSDDAGFARGGLVIPALLLASATPRVVTFPGPVRSVAAPDSSGARIFYRVLWKD